jgi:hypothetical protein
VKNALNKDCKEELNTQFVSSLDFEVQLTLLKIMLKLSICRGLMFNSSYAGEVVFFQFLYNENHSICLKGIATLVHFLII